MSSSTKIVVIPMKRLIMAGVAIVAVILLIIIIALSLNSEPASSSSNNIYNSNAKTNSDNVVSNSTNETVESNNTSVQGNTYIPGVYTASLSLNGNPVDIQVTVDKNNINNIEMVNVSDSITTMYPLIQNVFDEIANEVMKNGTAKNISYKADNKYTSTMILNAIDEALSKCIVR